MGLAQPEQTSFRRLTDPVGERVSIPWDEWFEAWEQRPEPFAEDKQPGWSAATFAGNRRAKDNVERVWALVLDIDHGSTIDWALDALGEWWGFLHTTRRHRPDGVRFRVVLPYTRAVTAAEHDAIWSRFDARWPGVFDAAARDASRFWYLPGPGAGGTYETRSLDGLTLDPDEVLTWPVKSEPPAAPVQAAPPAPAAFDGVRPGDAWARTTSWAAILEPRGWKMVGRQGDGTERWRRPGKTDGISATVAPGGGVFYCFTSSAPPLEAQKSYSKLGLYAALEHGGDMRAAVRELGQKGFGDQRPRLRVVQPDEWHEPDATTPEAIEASDPKAGGGDEYRPVQLEPARFKILDADAVYAELEPIEWVIDGIVPAGSIVEVESYGGSGKSWLAVDALVAVATNTPWLGRFPTLHGLTAYLDFENGQREMRRRIQACTMAHGFTRAEGLGLVTMPDIYLTDPRFDEAMLSLSDGRRIVVIDTLRAGVPDLDENDSRMRKPIDSLRRISEKTTCAYMMLLHAKKQSGNGRELDMREAGRGSSAIYDAADVVLHCTYDDGTLTVKCAKSRLGKAFEPFIATVQDTDDGGVSVVATDAPDETAQGERELDVLSQRVLDIVRRSPGLSARVIIAKAKRRAQDVAAALEVLVKSGQVENRAGGPRGAASYFSILGDDESEG